MQSDIVAHTNVKSGPLSKYSPPEMTVEQSTLDYTRLLYMHYLEMDALIRQADLKAQLTLGINAIFVAAGTASLTESIQQVLSQEATAWGQLFIAINGMAVFALIASIFFALFTIIPRTHAGKRGMDMYFYGAIIHFDEETYINRAMSTTMTDVKRAILGQIHSKSFIVARKFRGVRLSIICLALATFFWAFSRALPLSMV